MISVDEPTPTIFGDPAEFRRSLIRTHLNFAVPLRMMELRDVPTNELLERFREMRPIDKHGDPVSTLITGADEAMYGNGAAAGAAMNRIVDGLAIAALAADGGITFDGLHWCTNHQHCIDAEEGSR